MLGPQAGALEPGVTETVGLGRAVPDTIVLHTSVPDTTVLEPAVPDEVMLEPLVPEPVVETGAAAVPDYLCQHLTSLAASPRISCPGTASLRFPDGRVEADLVLLRAVSGLLRGCGGEASATILLPGGVSAGRHILSLLYTGRVSVAGHRDRLDLAELVQLLELEMDIVTDGLEATTETELNYAGTPCQDPALQPTELLPDVNQIIMSNMNQNDNNIVMDQVPADITLKLQNSPPKDRNRKVYICDFHPCVVQKLSFEGISKFKRHTHHVHGAKPLACPENKNGCKFRADDFSKLGNHVQGVHKNIYSENIVCEECHKSFPSQSYLKTHMHRMHRLGLADRGKICPYCGETKLQLNDHIMRAHRSQQFQCEYCPRKFKTSVQRRIHHNVHTGFRPYTCTDCDARFSRLHHRKKHLEKLGHTVSRLESYT